MKFDFDKALSIPFKSEKEEIEKDFLKWSESKNEVPIDFRTNARLLEMEKIYVPIRNFKNITYSAEWEARSYWEHTESYTEYESKIVYIDSYGNEHNSLQGAKICSENNYQPQAVSKNVPVKRYKTIIDKAENTDGILTKTAPSVKTYYSQESSDEFCKWIVKVSKKHSEDYKEHNCVSDSTILELYGNDKESFEKTEKKLYSEAETLCKEQIPGTSYKEFSITKFSVDFDKDIILVPLFCVRYEYKNQQYDYYVNGTNRDDIFVEKYPIDNEFVTIKNQLEKDISKKEDSKNLYLLGCLISCGLFVIGGIGLWIFGIGISLEILSIIGAIVLSVLYKRTNEKTKALQKELDYLMEKRAKGRDNLISGQGISEKICVHCGKVLNGNEKFCMYCGGQVNLEKNDDIYDKGMQKESSKEKVNNKYSRENLSKTTKQSQEKKWYQRTGGVILLLLLCFPIGIYVMWKYADWKKGIKIAISVLFGLFLIGCL